MRFVEEYDPSLPPVHGNRDLLVQVFLNLVKNAAEAAPAQGGEISSRPPTGTACASPVAGSDSRVHLPLVVAVTDNGAGIPEDLRRHLFDPFVTTKRNGTGLGLALVAKVIGDHGGVIEFDSQPRRTVFRVFCLPMVVARRSERCHERSTILVADDDRAIRTVLNQALGRLGHEVRTTGNAATLWRWVADGEGDLVITDVVMPDENGLDLIPRIKKLRPGTADHRDERAEHAADRGQGDRARRLRIPAEAVRPARAGQRRRARADRAAPRPRPPADRGRRRGAAAADRPLAGDAGDLPRRSPG